MRTCLECRVTLPYQKMGRKRLRCYPCAAEVHRQRQTQRARAAAVVPGDLSAGEIERRIDAHLAKLRKGRAA